jgi:hypothetical protein
MELNEVLKVLFGVVLGVLASVPVAMVIAASTRTRPLPRYPRDSRPPTVTVEPPVTAVVVFHPDA